MNITFLCETIRYGSQCTSASHVPGEEIEISSETSSNFSVNGRVVKGVPSDRVLLLDTCWGGRLKIVSDDCQFVMPTNNDEWSVVKPILRKLAERRVLVVSEVNYQCPDILAAIDECRKSFYSPSDGTLINKKFEWDNLTPEKMAEAGLMFVGDVSTDTTMCYFNKKHLLYSWRESDTPRDLHLYRFNPLCIYDVKYKIPVLSSEDGQKVPVQAYEVSMHSGDLNRICDKSFLISHSGAPIKVVSLSEIISIVNDAMQTEINSCLLEHRENGMAIDSQYFELLKQSISLTHFFGLLRDFKSIKYAFITELQRYKTHLHTTADLATADGLLEKLKSSSLTAEVGEIVKQLAALELVNENSIRLSFLPSATHKGISSSMELVARQELKKLADSYGQRYFVGDFLNGLIQDWTLCRIFASDCADSPQRSEELISLLAKGTELTQLLVRISEVIKELLEPFVVEEPCDCRPGIKPDSL